MGRAVAAGWANCSEPPAPPTHPPRSLVIDTLKEVDEARKCYRMVGGVLVERTVKEVLPALENNKEQVSGAARGAWRGAEGSRVQASR